MTVSGFLRICAGSGSLVLALSAPTVAQAESVDGLDAGDWAGIRAAYEAGRHAAYAVDGGYQTTSPGQQWRTRFDGRGFTTHPDAGAWTWGLELLRYGFGEEQRAVAHPTGVSAEGGRVEYDWDATLTEWYVNDTRGLEHGYTVRRRPAASGETADELSFTLAVRGELIPAVSADGRDVRFVDAEGADVLTYSGLTVFDADGETLPARLARVDEGLLLTVDERGARYPLTIDPIVQSAYLKASNTGTNDGFGVSVAVAGSTVAVGANGERSNATGIDGNQSDNSASNAGAVYVFVRNAGVWSQEAYIKASNTDAGDNFGASVSLSGDTLLIGAWGESSIATGVDGNEVNNLALLAGAAYVFVRDNGTWSQQAYLKASNTDGNDMFGTSVSLSGDTAVIGAVTESSNATGVDGDQLDNTALAAGAAYVFVRNGTTWSQQAYLKASNTDGGDNFGLPVSISGDTIAVGATAERSNATGVNGNEADNSASLAGAAYVFVRSGSNWSQEAYLKASNTDAGDLFGRAVDVSGNTIVVTASQEDSDADGVNGNEADGSATFAGAAYVYTRSGTTWSQQAYLKASNSDAFDAFGNAASVSGDLLVVGATGESSSAAGVDGDQSDNSMGSSGAAYVFTRDAGVWSQEAYLKSSNPGAVDFFGTSVSVGGNLFVVGARLEDSGATGVNGNQSDNGTAQSGAAYLFALRGDRTKIMRFNGMIETAEDVYYDDYTDQPGLSAGGPGSGLRRFQAVKGDPPALRVAYDRGGAAAVLWVGTQSVHDGQRWLVQRPLWKHRLVLDGDGSLEVPLSGLPRELRGESLFAQLVVLDREGVVTGPVVEIPPLGVVR